MGTGRILKSFSAFVLNLSNPELSFFAAVFGRESCTEPVFAWPLVSFPVGDWARMRKQQNNKIPIVNIYFNQ
jgi:hypothetical protein